MSARHQVLGFIGARLHAASAWLLQRAAAAPPAEARADIDGFRGAVRTGMKVGYSGAHVLIILEMPGGIVQLLPLTPTMASRTALDLRQAAARVEATIRAARGDVAGGMQ